MNWTNCPPALTEANYDTTISLLDQALAMRMAEAFKRGHQVAVVELSSATMQNRGLRCVAEMAPEIASCYEHLTGHQMKTVVIVDENVEYKTPVRDGDILIKPPGWTINRGATPHVAYCDFIDAEKFASYGSSTLTLVVKKRGVLDSMDHIMKGLAAALGHRRIESLLVVTDEKTSQVDWQTAHDTFGKEGITVGYSRIEYQDLFH